MKLSNNRCYSQLPVCCKLFNFAAVATVQHTFGIDFDHKSLIKLRESWQKRGNFCRFTIYFYELLRG